MKANLSKFRLPRRIVLILAGGIVLSGASAAFAVYVGTEAILGPPQSQVSGLDCTNIQLVKLRRNGQRWVRKFVRTESTDGLVRIRTALRVASALSKAEKADLYQVVVIDQNGPDTRGAMRGRAIGADVLFTPRPGDIPGMDVSFTARYVDGKANAMGLFSGEKIELPLDDIKLAIRSIEDHSDCVDPPVPEGEEAKAGGHAKAPDEGHGKPAEHGSSEGEAAPAHGEEAAPAHGEEAGEHAAAPEGDVATAHEEKAHEPTFEDFAALDTDSGNHGSADKGHHEAAPEAVTEEVEHGEKPAEATHVVEAEAHAVAADGSEPVDETSEQLPPVKEHAAEEEPAAAAH